MDERKVKHIVIDARESGTSTGVYVDNLIKYLYKLQPTYKITVITKKHRAAFMQEIAPNFDVQVSHFKEFTFGEQLGFLGQIKKLQPDLVHFSMVQQPVLYRGKVVTTMHDLTTTRFRNPTKNWLVFTLKQQIYKWVNRHVAHKSNAIITPSEFVRDDVAQFARINSRKVTVTYEAADKITDKPEIVDEVHDKPFIMYVGRPQPHKNLERLVDAYAILKKKHPKMKLVFVGKTDAAYKQLAKYAASHNISGLVFTGWASEGQKRWLYENTGAYVFPSLSEGFGLPSLEAMMHGAPVVSSNATCLPEINKDAALYFDPLDTEAMVETIEKIMSDKQQREKLIAKGRALAKTYSWQRMAEQTLDIYEQVLRG